MIRVARVINSSVIRTSNFTTDMTALISSIIRLLRAISGGKVVSHFVKIIIIISIIIIIAIIIIIFAQIN